MKTRQKPSPAKSSLIENRKKERKKRDVDKTKVVIALNKLVGEDSSIIEIDDKVMGALTTRFKVSQHIIRSKVAELQPRVAVEKM